MVDVKTQVEAKYDVAIIGSGPAGASSAKALSGAWTVGGKRWNTTKRLSLRRQSSVKH